MNKSFLIHKHKGAENLEIQVLGRINVICGKNNSGKTTILEAISNRQKSSFGLTIPSEIITEVISESLQIYKECFSRIDMLPGSNPQIRDILKTANRIENHLKQGLEEIMKGKIHYYSLIADYANLVKDLSTNAITGEIIDGLSNSQSAFTRKITELIPTPIIMIVPATRTITSCHSDVRHNISLDNAGNQLIECLHSLQNSSPDSEEHKILSLLKEGFSEVSGGYSIKTVIEREESKIGLIFKSSNQSQWVDYKSIGQGMLDLLIILYHYTITNCDWLLIDEIENHMHPEMQRRLANYIKNICNKNIILTTHSSVFLSPVIADKAFSCMFKDNHVQIEEVTSRMEVLSDLGYSPSDNLLADAVVLVEGPSDKGFFEEIFTKAGLYPKYNIKIWPIGGDAMYHSELSLFADTGNTMAVIDKDPKSSKARKRFMEECNRNNIPCIRLMHGYSIENYIPLEVYRTVFGAQINGNIKSIERKYKVENQIGLNPKKSMRKLARHIKLDTLMETDFREVIEVLNSILK